jgi:hypothetical protein
LPERPADEDFLPFDQPVRERPAASRAERATAPETAEKEADGPWRLRVRRWGLCLLAATAVLFLVLQLSGFMPQVFFVHMPLLAVVAVLVAGGTAKRVPRGTPQLQNPINWALLTAIVFFAVGGTLIHLANTEPAAELAGRFRGLYTGLGLLALLVLLKILKGIGRLGVKAPPPSAGRGEA